MFGEDSLVEKTREKIQIANARASHARKKKVWRMESGGEREKVEPGKFDPETGLLARTLPNPAVLADL